MDIAVLEDHLSEGQPDPDLEESHLFPALTVDTPLHGEVIPADLVLAEVAEAGQKFGGADEIGEKDAHRPAALCRRTGQA